jgi:TctA family transporter
MVEMFSALSSGLIQVFNWSTFSLMMIGIAVGFVVGILPGLGGPTAMALMLPFVFKMNAVEAFAFLLGMTAVTATTGDITSVLFGVPGEPTTASTIVDGHAMARKGEAGRALGGADEFARRGHLRRRCSSRRYPDHSSSRPLVRFS